MIRMSYHVLFLIFLLHTLTFQAYCECDLPPDLDGAWWDSSAGNVQFSQTTKQLDGWSFTVYTQSLSAFTCVESVDNILLFKSNKEANTFGALYYGFLCMVYTNITSSSFRYYLKADEEPDEASKQRVKMMVKENALEPYDVNVICNPVNGPSLEEYHVLVKQDKQSLLNQYLPDILLGVFSYSVNDGDSSYCIDGSLWDSCTNKTSINLNYTLCSTVMFGSATGHLYSVTYVLQGSTYYVTVINSDGQDTLFTCLAVVSSGGKIVMSTNPGSCEKGQTPFSRTSNQESVLITLSQYAFNSDNSDLSSDTDINILALIVGLFAALVFLIVALSAFVLYRKCFRRRSHIHHVHRRVIPGLVYPKKITLADAGIGDVVLHSPRV
ncbi:uncharacterized protein LOC127736685 [Mytilus californianus]|uniref:uncharacterized protein LOC127736685 n=1 Tax=Mytilus californianus TaxID=6549 RepID=UPI00224640F3|nr:uncharacterized protein LOC127736685 [Mytilus californianus]